jgi:rhodanese-related sulfurtransferase
MPNQAMTYQTSLSSAALSSLIGTSQAPAIVDVRTSEDFARDPRLIPGSRRRDPFKVVEWAQEFAQTPVVVVCQRGQKLSQGAAAWLRHCRVQASVITGGFEAWAAAGVPLIRTDRLPVASACGASVWVTRSRPKVDRIACPWLIRRFIDPDAVFLFVEPEEVPAVAERFGATPFDIENVFWSHRGDRCTFDVMLDEFGLKSPALDRMATIVRGADTGQFDLSPQAAGFLAVSLGLSRLFEDDLAQLGAALTIYDALYLWCRDGTHETHGWRTAERLAPLAD